MQALKSLLPIQFSNVNLQYANKPILQSLDLAFSAHGISFLLGENGAGKTQILRCIHGLSTPNSGHINAPPRQQQAYLHQAPILLNRSVKENLYFIRGCLAAPESLFDQQFDAVIQRFALSDLLSQSASTLSGGQRKRVALARLFLQQANCYLFDEPAANIDRKTNRIIESAISERAEQGYKIIITTHNFFQLQRLFCEGRDEVLVIKNGRLATIAKHTDSDLFNRYL